jgi:hypothetical protein
VQDALPIVIVAVVVAFGLVGVAAVLLSRTPYERIGRSGNTFDSEATVVDGVTRAELEAEVRRFVIARNERLVARGRPPLDVETEVERRLSGQDG